MKGFRVIFRVDLSGSFPNVVIVFVLVFYVGSFPLFNEMVCPPPKQTSTGVKLAKISWFTSQFDCPLTQYQLADTLRLSAIHVNSMLRELREGKMMIFAEH